MASKAKDVATIPDQQNAVVGYDYGDDAGMGMEGMTSADVSIPFINLLQPLSPEVSGDTAIDGAKPGDFYNSVSREIIPGKTGFLFQPCERQHVFVEWVPRDAGGGFVAIHTDDSPEVIEARRANGGKSYGTLKHGDNDLIETVYVYGHVLGDDGVTPVGFAVLAATSTKLKPLRDAMTIVWTTRVCGKKPPLFAFRWKITSKSEKNKKGQPYFNISVNPKAAPLLNPGVPAEADLLSQGKMFLTSVRDGVRRADPSSAAPAREPGVEDADTPF